MARQILQLGSDELWRVLELVDPVELTAATLLSRADGAEPGDVPAGRLVPDPDRVAAAGAPVLFEDPDGQSCLLPADGLAELRTAALAALAARELLAPGVVTAAVLGSGSAVQLAVVARHVPGITFVAVCPANGAGTVPVELRVLDLFDRAGISLSVTAGVDEAVFGTNLLVIADSGPGKPRLDQLAAGAVLVNASGRDLPEQVVQGVDEIYVDDLGVLAEHRHRRFVRMHLDRSAGPPEPIRQPEGWHRRPEGGRRRVDADLGQVLAGTHPGRRLADDILLVELLSTRGLDVALAGLLQRAALEHGVGTWLFE